MGCRDGPAGDGGCAHRTLRGVRFRLITGSRAGMMCASGAVNKYPMAEQSDSRAKWPTNRPCRSRHVARSFWAKGTVGKQERKSLGMTFR